MMTESVDNQEKEMAESNSNNHSAKQQTLIFEKPILVYLPCYNCAQKVTQTLDEIPEEFNEKIECLVIDNHSDDGTTEAVLEKIKNGTYPFKVNIVRTKENVGYAGSQKLAYFIAINSPDVKKVIALHGDGQYPPEMLKEFIPYLNKDHALVNGYRSKRVFGEREETPFGTYVIIKILSSLESLVVGIPAKEWHSGFVMYEKDFLKRIPLHRLSPWMHIDGEFLLCANVLKEEIVSVPIYKRYKGFICFGGIPRIKHIWHVFKVMASYKKKYYHRILETGEQPDVAYEYTIESNQS